MMSSETEGDRLAVEGSRPKSWIRTWPSYTRFELLAPTPAMVDPRDIAHHLSNLCRFTGGCRRFYSVAEHCVRVSLRAEERVKLAYEEQRRLWGLTMVGGWVKEGTQALASGRGGLMHDSGEGYYQDLNSPLKHQPEMAFYRQLEQQALDGAIWPRFGLGKDAWFEVHAADAELLMTERRDLLRPDDPEWDETVKDKSIKPLEHVQVAGWYPPKAERLWLKRFLQLWPDWTENRDELEARAAGWVDL